MGKSTSVKREIRFQQWIQQVKEYNERPDGMSMSAWCKTRGIAQSTFATRLQRFRTDAWNHVRYQLNPLNSQYHQSQLCQLLLNYQLPNTHVKTSQQL
ncbi:MAG: hypothetical protein ACLTS6_00855 [Anaerobutyricum sp.]